LQFRMAKCNRCFSRNKAMRVSDVLKPHLTALHEIISGAHDDYENFYPPQAKIVHDASTKAHIINRHMLARASLYAASNPRSVKAFESKRLHGIICSQLLAILFKKLDRELRGRNHVSKQIDDYMNQREIDEIPAVLKLVAGYRENDETGEIIGTWVTRPQGDINRWELILSGDEAEQKGTIPLFDQEEQGEEEVEITPRKQPGEIIPIKRGAKDDDDDKP
jgi:hypothetical protein